MIEYMLSFFPRVYACQIHGKDLGASVITVVLSCEKGRLFIHNDTFSAVNYTHSEFVPSITSSFVEIIDSVTVESNSMNGLSLTGAMSLVNKDLTLLSYQGGVDSYGYDHISISVSVEGSRTSPMVSSDLRVRVVPLNDAPLIEVAGTSRGQLYDNASVWELGVIHALEDAIVPIGTHFSIRDGDYDRRLRPSIQLIKILARVDTGSLTIDSFPHADAVCMTTNATLTHGQACTDVR